MLIAIPTDLTLGLATLAIELVTVVGSVGIVVYKLGNVVARFEAIGEKQAGEIGELKEDVKSLSKILTELALQSQRQTALQEQVNRIDRLIEDLRRGEGFILPFPPRS